MTELSEHFKTALRDLSATLDPIGILWAVVGAVAANNYRDQVRTTTDLDVLLSLADKNVDVVIETFHQHGWHSVEIITDSLLRAQHPYAGRLDVLVSGTEYEKGAIARAHQIDLGQGRFYRTVAIEDVMILKLLADRFIDNADIESILLKRPELEWSYMSHWLQEFDLEGRLQRIEDAAIASGALTEKIRRN